MLPESVLAEKMCLCRILKMMIGLRASWLNRSMVLHEDRGDGQYGSEGLFNHESLDVYMAGIELARRLYHDDVFLGLSDAHYRKLDEPLTSIVLNIAEANGRYSVVDQKHFIEISHESAIKLAARLDLFAVRQLLPGDMIETVKKGLERIAAMTTAMIAKPRKSIQGGKLTTRLTTKGTAGATHSWGAS